MSLSDEQLAIRRTMVTASDTYTLAGEGYDGHCALSIYADKVLQEPRKPATVTQRIGQLLEPLCIDLLEEERGLIVDRANVTNRHGILPWLGATTDGRIRDEQGNNTAVVEAKAVMHWGGRQKWQGDLPADRVVIQTTIQMLVERTRRAYVPAILGGEFRIYELELDDIDLGPSLLEMNQAFWERNVLPRCPPAPDASEGAARALRRLYPRVKGGILPASRAAEEHVRVYFEAMAAMAAAEKLKDGAKNALMAEIGEHGGIEHGAWRAMWNETKVGRRLLVRGIEK